MLVRAQREFIPRKDQGSLHKEGVILNVLKMPDNKKRKVPQGCVSGEKEEAPWQPAVTRRVPSAGTDEARRECRLMQGSESRPGSLRSALRAE